MFNKNVLRFELRDPWEVESDPKNICIDALTAQIEARRPRPFPVIPIEPPEEVDVYA